MSGTPATNALLEQVTATALRLFDAAACSIALIDDDQLVYTHASGQGAEVIVGTRMSLIRGIAGWAVRSGQPVAISDVRGDPRFAHDVAESTGYIPQAIVAAPLQTDRGTYGVSASSTLPSGRSGSCTHGAVRVSVLGARGLRRRLRTSPQCLRPGPRPRRTWRGTRIGPGRWERTRTTCNRRSLVWLNRRSPKADVVLGATAPKDASITLYRRE